MFIRITKNSAGQRYYHLAESYRVGRKVKQRILLSLGRVEDGRLQALSDALSKHTKLLSALEIAKSISVDRAYVLGPLLVLKALFAQLGIDEALRLAGRNHKKLKFNVRDAVFALVCARFTKPSSKLAVYEQLLKRLYPHLAPTDLELEHLYRVLDVLAQDKDLIEKSLFMHGRDLYNRSVDVVLYDLTTLRFESTREDLGQLCRFGYSKERRSDCTQVVLGLLVDPEGIPLGFEVYPGNTVETATLKDIVKKMTKKFSVRRFIVVADRGVLSSKNLDTLRQNGAQFIIGMRIGKLGKKRPELFDRKGFERISDELEILHTSFGIDRGIVAWTKTRAERDRKTRDDIVAKIVRKLSGKKKVSAKSFISNTNYHAFLKGIDAGVPQLDTDKLAEAEKRDGFFALVTNIDDMSPVELWAHYKDLWRIEDSFGELKGTLKARPVFHWTDHRITGHLVMCFIALLCEAHITRLARHNGQTRAGRASDDGVIESRPLCAAPVIADLADVRVVPVTIADHTYWVRTDIAGNAAQIFRALGLRIPPNVIRIDSHPGQPVVAQTNSVDATV